VTGASLMFRGDALRETGLFDDGFFLYFEEVELMHRMKAADWSIRHVPESRVVHAEGASTGLGAESVRPLPAYWYRSRQRYFALTGGLTAGPRADLAWLAGRGLAIVKRAFGRRPKPTGQRAADMFLVARRSMGRASVVAWGDAPGSPPAWMARR
jgi:N-acetylglucosaminyl-diphospho-decaprenol L-rhamnosyltransferase